MRNNPKIDAAREASSKIGKVVDDAMLELQFHFEAPLNGHGCLNDIKSVRDDTCTAIEHLQKALTMIDEINWPTDAEYDNAWAQKSPKIHVVK